MKNVGRWRGKVMLVPLYYCKHGQQEFDLGQLKSVTSLITLLDCYRKVQQLKLQANIETNPKGSI